MSLNKWRKTNKKVFDLLNKSLQEINTSSSEDESPDVCLEDANNENILQEGINSSSDEDSITSESLTENFVFSQSDNSLPDFNLADKLALWYVNQTNLSQNGMRDLLTILRENGHPDLPKDPRTLVSTPSNIQCMEKCGGTYIYLGIEKHLKMHETTAIDISFNIDGISLFKSSSLALWPILCEVNNKDVFPVALFVGEKKPNDINDYLYDFVEELNQIMQNGIYLENGGHAIVNVKAFICDAPARAFVKGIVGHCSKNACERCTIVGLSVDRRIVFTGNTCFPLRTSEGFKNLEYEDHQKEVSPLSDVGINCVSQFSLDYMHLVCLGVTRRILNYLKKEQPCKLSHGQQLNISTQLIDLRPYIPTEFARRPRSLIELDRWKATEFKQFLLYTGPIVLKDVLPVNMYNHFVKLSVSIKALCNENDFQREINLPLCRQMILDFVKDSPLYYGNTFPVYNVHGLVHLCDDIDFFKCSLDKISAFPYENFLGKLKKLVRSPINPAVQITKRLSEIESLQLTIKDLKTKISCHQRDRCFFTEQNEVVFLQDINLEQVICHAYHTSLLQSFYEEFDSRIYGIFFLPATQRNFTEKLLPYNALSIKGICLPCSDGFVVSKFMSVVL